MFTGAAWAAITAALKPLAEAFLSTFSDWVNDWLRDQRAAQAQQDVGRVTAERDQAIAANKVKDAELDAAVNAPREVDDAIKRLEEGSA